jgi:diguanylate cyclase (GGDEF)-like protein
MTVISAYSTPPDPLGPTIRTIAAAAMGAGAAVMGFFAVWNWEARAADQSFKAVAQENAHTLQSGLNDYIDHLVCLRGLFFGAPEAKVSRGDFETFARDLMQDVPGLLAMSWSPRVMHDERDAHERAAQADGIHGYRIKAVGAADKILGPQEERPDYYPVHYSTLPYDAKAYGIDLQDSGVRQRPLDKARDLDVFAATANFRLQSKRGRGYEFYVVLPVYRPGAPHLTLGERRENILGFVRGPFQFHLMVEAALNKVEAPVNVYVFEAGSDGSAQPIYARRDGMMSDEKVPRGELTSQEFQWTGTLSLADRSWDVVVVPSGAASLAYHRAAWIVLAAGIILAMLLAAYVWTSARYVRMLEDANSLISEQALTDPLTGLSNRRHFVERLTEAFASADRTGDRFAVHFLDLDGFKRVNDTYGHPMGDALLKAVANRIEAHTRTIDVAARFGGDEFAVLQNLVGSPSDANLFAEKLVDALAAPYLIEGVELHVSASLGMALQTPQTEGPTGIMMQADLALYSAKAAGRNCVRLYSSEFDGGALAAFAAPARSSAA